MKIRNRIIAAFLCLCMMAFYILTLAACGKKECSHEYGRWFKIKNATCTEDGSEARKCKHCSDVETCEIKALRHDWSDATCTTPKTCKRCSITEGSALAHNFTVETVKAEALKTAASCASAAVYYKSCSCGAISTNAEEVFINGSALEHVDANRDHVCDNGCSTLVVGCNDNNKDHLCDYGCGKTFGEHTDGDDNNHLCDYGCNKIADDGCYDFDPVDGKCDECSSNMGHICADDDKNHLCDSCGATLSQHYDVAKDHTCDYCSATIGVCEDADKNHKCDYGCDKTYGEHADGDDADHLCDYGCNRIADDGCYDFVVNGKCDECNAEIEHDCVDVDPVDHACDICSTEMGNHFDIDFNHTCDYGCSKPIGTCADENLDHKCDYGFGYKDGCKKEFGEHADSDSDTDHVCDYGCGVSINECEDKNDDGDHRCDVCGQDEITAHSFSQATCAAPATCYECGITSGSTLSHIDENFDHVCDNGCGKTDMGDHEDGNDDNHLCDYGCNEVMSPCEDSDTDADHNCDICGKESVTVHSYRKVTTAATCENAQIDTYTCNCGHSYFETLGIALGHDEKTVERKVSGCEYVVESICKRDNCGKIISSKTEYRHKYVASIGKEATCQEDGYKTFKCSECGDTGKENETIPADPNCHVWSLGKTVENNIRIDKCSVKNCTATREVTVYTKEAENLTKEDFKKEIEVNNANISLDQGVINQIGDDTVTLTADKLEGDDRKNLGLTEEQLESQVGDSPIYNFTINNGSKNISNFGEGNYVTITLPYELADGEDVDSIAIWFISDVCTNEECDNYGTEDCDEVSHKLVSMIATYNNGYITFKTNHFSYYTVTRLTPSERCELYGHVESKYTVEGSCTSDGYTYYICVRCHADRYENYVEAPGHDYKILKQTEKTCVTNGSITYKCETCNDEYTVTDFAKGHSWSVVKVVDATCAANGYTKYGCDNCDEEYSIAIAKKAHSYTIEIVPATCSADGYTLHDCKECDYSYKDKFVDAIGHSYEVGEWTWSADYSAATLSFVCKNDNTHVTVVKADVTFAEQEGACSTYVKFIYTAVASYNGTEYSDIKTFEKGDPSHNFADTWLKNGDEHWQECICGEKTNVTAHTFGESVTVKEPTCSEAGQSVAYCTVCNQAKKTVISATGEHNYENGVCTDCGKEFVDSYYINLVNSYKNINGFAIKLENLSIEIKEQSETLADVFELIGSIKQVDITELSLSFNDGEIAGAAIGSLVIFNGPLVNANAVYNFKAVIYEDNVYINVMHGKDTANKVMNVKLSVDSILNSLFENMDVDIDSNYLVDFVNDSVLPAVDTLIDLNKDKTSEILENLFNIIFTFEKQVDGSYVVTLDYAKLYALNDNLANKSVSEVIDIYFGNGAFDDIVEFINEILELELSEIPEYLDEKGLDSNDLAKKINEFYMNIGVDDDYDIIEWLKSEENKGITLGMLIYGTDDDSYIEEFNDFVAEFRSKTIYDMMGMSNSESFKDNIDTIIDALSKSSVISFTTDSTGMIISIAVDVNDFSYEYEGNRIDAELNLDIIFNESIDVNWNDIVDEIEKDIVLPEPDSLDSSVQIGNSYYGNGEVNYKGETYIYNKAKTIYAYKYLYDKLNYIIASQSCSGWTEYTAAYSKEVYSFALATIKVNDKNVTLLIDHENHRVVELIQTETGYTVVFSDDTTKDIIIGNDYSSTEEKLIATYIAVYEEGGLSSSIGTKRYYYNKELGQYSNEDPHSYKTECEVLGDTCSDGRVTHTTCENCDYYSSSKTNWCEQEEGVIDLSDISSCGSKIYTCTCVYCGRTDSMTFDISCCIDSVVVEEITDDDGHVIGERRIEVCNICNLTYITEDIREYVDTCKYNSIWRFSVYSGEKCVCSFEDKGSGVNHNYEYTYELIGESCDDGYWETAVCTLCQETRKYSGFGHAGQYTEIHLSELGLCGGIIDEFRCRICDEVVESYVDDVCNWYYIDSDMNGNSIAQCQDCGAKRITTIENSEKDENCNYTSVSTKVYIVNDEEVYRASNTTDRSSHNYIYDFELKGDSCLDGYKVHVTCADCDFSQDQSGKIGQHTTYTVYRGSQSGACDNHNIAIDRCPCGDKFYIYYDRTTFEYDNESGLYVCDVCGIQIQDNESSVDDGCLKIKTNTLSITKAGEEVYSFSNDVVYTNHAFEKIETAKNGNVTTVTATCTKCGEQKSHELINITTTKTDKGYSYDYSFIPQTSGRYLLRGVNDYSKYGTYISIYKFNNGKWNLVAHTNSNQEFYIEASLTAGTEYLFRFCDSAYAVAKEEQRFVFSITENIDSSMCQHSWRTSFTMLLDGSKTCEDGLYVGDLYEKCGCIASGYFDTYHKKITKENISLAEYGACHGSFIYFTCACGEQDSFELSSCAYTDTNNKYYDEEGRLITVEVRKCNSCGLSYTSSYYTVKNYENCTLDSYYTIVVKVGINLIFSNEYVISKTDHDYTVNVSLNGGNGSSCEDGVTFSKVCKDCGFEEIYQTNSHDVYEKEKIEVSGVCGGYAVVSGCACGQYNSVSLDDILCDLDYVPCDIWIDDVITGGYENTIEGYNSYWYSSGIYTCAVTEPADAACNYKIRYANYWLKAEDECYVYEYKTWQFGYNEETGEFEREITIKTGAYHSYHNYVSKYDKNNVTHECPDCGSYYRVMYEYENGNCIKEEKYILNTLDGISDKYYKYVCETQYDDNGNMLYKESIERREYIDDKGNPQWSEYQKITEPYSTDWSEYGEKTIKKYNYSYSDISMIEETAGVYYKGSYFSIYYYESNGDYWSRRDYTYSFDGVCSVTYVFTDSNGDNSTQTYQGCKNDTVVLKEPTCSQEGERCNQCRICGNQSDFTPIIPRDHTWVMIEENHYYCTTCGIENANGASGNIIMEDLTEAYGNGENYVVGYYVGNNVQFTQYVALILEDGTEVPIMSGVQINTVDDVRAFSFSKKEVEAWAKANGYENYEVRFVFVPVASDGSFDYGLTFTEKNDNTTIVGDTAFIDCIDSQNNTYVITPAKSGEWHFTVNSDTYCEIRVFENEYCVGNYSGSEFIDFYMYLNEYTSYTLVFKHIDNKYIFVNVDEL